MISSSAGKGKGNYLPIRVNRRSAVGITTGLPSMAATISCIHSQQPQHDLALEPPAVILLTLFRIVIIYTWIVMSHFSFSLKTKMTQGAVIQTLDTNGSVSQAFYPFACAKQIETLNVENPPHGSQSNSDDHNAGSTTQRKLTASWQRAVNTIANRHRSSVRSVHETCL